MGVVTVSCCYLSHHHHYYCYIWTLEWDFLDSWVWIPAAVLTSERCCTSDLAILGTSIFIWKTGILIVAVHKVFWGLKGIIYVRSLIQCFAVVNVHYHCGYCYLDVSPGFFCLLVCCLINTHIFDLSFWYYLICVAILWDMF